MNDKPKDIGSDIDRMERRSFLIAMAMVSVAFLYLLAPFFGAIFWACVIGLLFSPLQRWLLQRWGERRNLAALVTLAACLTIAVLPALFITTSIVQQGASLYQRLQSGEIDLGQAVERVRQGFPLVQQLLDRFNIDFATLKSALSSGAVATSRFLASNAVEFGQNTAQWFVSFGLMLYVAFFMLRDGAALVRLLGRALPLGDAREELLFAKFAEVTRATVKGNLVVAAVQGSLGGITFFFLGLPAPLLWGVVMTVLSLIPMVGAGLVWAPVALYLFAVGSWIKGLVLVGVGVGVIGLADNVLRPLLVGRDTKLPDYLVLLSTLGGFALFGINGFVVGPLLAALFIAFWQIFMREFNVTADDTGEEGAEAQTGE
ncbi:MAG: AI-2E family transporter [Desulfuromonas sp.]|nr:MAG: AI-2E family transporter [Desulfuromonas sp.]